MTQQLNSLPMTWSFIQITPSCLTLTFNTILTKSTHGLLSGKCAYLTLNVISFTLAQSNIPHSYNIDDNIISTVDSVADLGVIVDVDLRFKKHINIIVQKANKRSALIKRSFISKKTSNLVRSFKTYVRPLLEYSSTAWSPSYITYINQIESVQRHFTKFLPNCKYLSYAPRLTTLKLQSLEHRWMIADLVMRCNIIHDNNCLNPQTFFIRNFSAISRGHPVRISVHLATLNVRQHFYATRVTPIWNSLPTEMVTTPSVHQFKSGIIKTDLSKFLTIPTIYGK